MSLFLKQINTLGAARLDSKSDFVSDLESDSNSQILTHRFRLKLTDLELVRLCGPQQYINI